MNRRGRLATNNKVKIIDKASPYFGRNGILIEPKHIPVGLKLEYHWLVKIGDIETTELFAPKQLRKFD